MSLFINSDIGKVKYYYFISFVIVNNKIYLLLIVPKYRQGGGVFKKTKYLKKDIGL